ncbi:hypothetical protein VB636_00360, partial [Paracoccus sp. APAP_BH8]|uniref:hypothetical protein n=1 Tax=Paracoccus sp. APAP_BH8 TaxID=3110237 RepID=UPI002FD7B070
MRFGPVTGTICACTPRNSPSGQLIDGVWHDEWYDTESSGGRFQRSAPISVASRASRSASSRSWPA